MEKQIFSDLDRSTLEEAVEGCDTLKQAFENLRGNNFEIVTFNEPSPVSQYRLILAQSDYAVLGLPKDNYRLLHPYGSNIAYHFIAPKKYSPQA